MARAEQRKKRKSRKKSKLNGKLIIGFIVFEILFTLVTAPFILLYGPFETAKKTFLSTAMSSMHYKWLATTVMHEAEINEYLGITAYQESDISNKDSDKVKIENKNDDSNTVKCYKIPGNSKFDGYVLEVSNPKKVKVGYSSKLGKEGEKTSTIAKNNNAIAAINGGAFTDGNADAAQWTQNGGIPEGTIMTNGKIIFNNLSMDSKVDQIAITKDCRLLIGKWSLNELINEQDVSEIVSFTPSVLIVNGEKVVAPEMGTSPKTLIGQKENGNILLVVLDSSTDTRISATTKESQELMYRLGCVTEASLDGGKSTTMYYKGEIVNKPSNPTGERAIASAIVVLP